MTTKDYHFLLWLYITEAYLEKKGKSLHRRVPAPGILFSASLNSSFLGSTHLHRSHDTVQQRPIGFWSKKKKNPKTYTSVSRCGWPLKWNPGRSYFKSSNHGENYVPSRVCRSRGMKRKRPSQAEGTMCSSVGLVSVILGMVIYPWCLPPSLHQHLLMSEYTR